MKTSTVWIIVAALSWQATVAEPIPAPLLERRACNADNCLRALQNTQRASIASSFCTSLLATTKTGLETPLPTLVANCGTGTTQISRASSACSCFLPSDTTLPPTTTPTTTPSTTTTASPPGETCPAPSTVTLATTITVATTITEPPTTVTIPTTTTVSTITTVTVSVEPEPSCEQLFVNTGFTAAGGSIATLGPWGFWEEGQDTVMRLTFRRPSFDDRLQVRNSVGGFRAFDMSQVVRPCTGRRYYMTGDISCVGCASDWGVYIFHEWYRSRSGGGWQQFYTTRSDHDNWAGGLMTVEIGRDSPFTAPVDLGPNDRLGAAFHVRLVPPSGSTVPWTLYLDNVELVALPE